MKLFFRSAVLAIAAFGFAITGAAADSMSPYMHGSSDEKALKIDVKSLMGDNQKDCLDIEEKIVAGDIKVNSAVLRLEGTNYKVTLDGIVLPVTTLQNLAGQNVRFHIWMKGENISARGQLWSAAPAVTLSFYDDYSNLVCSAESIFKTRGTFPWHCYYIDLAIPPTFALTEEAYKESVKPDTEDSIMIKELLGDAAAGKSVKPGLYISFSNFGGGKVWFGGLSYEKISKIGVYGDNWKDTIYGTMAPNPAYDELPVILFNGLDGHTQWNFLGGNKAFGNLKTNEGLLKYLRENSDDWFHLQKGIAKLPYLYVTARELNLDSGFEDKWLSNLKNFLVSIQDPETGLWKANGVPNIIASSAIAAGCFSPRSQWRSDENTHPTPWNSVGADEVLPRAEEIIRTLLSCRVAGTAGWNIFALQPEDIRKANDSKNCDLTVTAAAVKLLSIAAQTLPADNQQRINAQEAIRDALRYALNEFVMVAPRLTWKDNSNSVAPAVNGVGLLEIIEASRWLEHRSNTTVSKPEMEVKDVTIDRPSLELSWKNTGDASINSVRIYCVPADVEPHLITDKNLVGIISRDNSNVRNQDPFISVKSLLAAARREWNITPVAANAVYTESKLKQTAQFAKAVSSKKIRVTTPDNDAFAAVDGVTSEFKFYAAAANSYGEISGYVALEAAVEELNLESQF